MGALTSSLLGPTNKSKSQRFLLTGAGQGSEVKGRGSGLCARLELETHWTDAEDLIQRFN